MTNLAHKLATLLFFCLSLPCSAQVPSLDWARQLKGNGNDVAYSVTTDSDGNLYSVGIFQDSIDLDPGVGVATFISIGGFNTFIQKLDQNGDFVWGKQFNGVIPEIGTFIVTDELGNVYVAGVFLDTLDLDPYQSITEKCFVLTNHSYSFSSREHG